MIPKIIHYVWLGGGEQSETIKKCFDSWKKYLADYKIMRWDENTYNMEKAPKFVKDAYMAKKWAFASDYIRLWALDKYGGVYLDTDTEVRKPLNPFLNNIFFIGTQVFPIDINKKVKKNITNLSMGVIGTVPGHPYLSDCMHVIESSNLIKPDGTFDTKVTNYTMSDILQKKYGFTVEDKEQHLKNGIIVYPSSVFADRLSPMDSPNAYTFHWGEMSWFQSNPRGLLYKICWNFNLMRLYHRIEKIRMKYQFVL